MKDSWKTIRERYDALNLKKGIYAAAEYDYYDIPLLQSQKHEKVEKLIPFSRKPHNGYVHFFLDDYYFERVWNKPQKYLPILKKYHGALTPDFSLYTDYPIAVQIWNTYRNRWLGRYWQEHGIKVIPTVTWSTPESYEFCFDGILENNTVAVSSVGVLQNKKAIKLFLEGYNHLIDIIEPEQILFYGSWPDKKELPGNITFYNNYAVERLRKLNEM